MDTSIPCASQPSPGHFRSQGHKAEEMRLQSSPRGGCREGGWDFTCVNCTPKIRPGSRLWEFPILFATNVLFIKLSHCKPLFRSRLRVEMGCNRKRGAHPRTASPGLSGMPWVQPGLALQCVEAPSQAQAFVTPPGFYPPLFPLTLSLASLLQNSILF